MNNNASKEKARKARKSAQKKVEGSQDGIQKTDVGLRSLLKEKKSRLSLIAVAVLAVIALGGLAYAKNQADDKAVEPATVLEIPSAVDTARAGDSL